jgi:hypothetical protein
MNTEVDFVGYLYIVDQNTCQGLIWLQPGDVLISVFEMELNL